MPKSSNQKLKLLYLLKILMEQTDEQHPMSTAALIEALAAYSVSAERKSIYSDIEELMLFGIDIEKRGGRERAGYYIASRDFELAELKLLVDAVQSSKFITGKKTEQLIKKLSALTNRYDAAKLNRQVFVANRNKTQNESVLYNIDDIHRAIQTNKKIEFRYYEWSVQKKLVARKEGAVYRMSPLALVWDDENYYLVAYDTDMKMRKHFRVDKMKQIVVLEDNADAEADRMLDLAAYSKSMFGMFGGETKDVTLQCPCQKIGILLDRFGTDISVRQADNECCTARVRVAVSEQFFGWLSAIGTDVTILTPESVRCDYREHLKKILDNY